MDLTFIIIILTFLILLISILVLSIILIKNKKSKDMNSIYYKKLFFLRKSELRFLKKINLSEDEYAIIPKLSLKKIIKTDNKKYKKELKKMTVDYAIFDKAYYQVLLLIELKYQSKDINNQAKIDKLKKICDEAGIKFITFTANSDKMSEQEINNEIREIIKKNI